MLINSTALRAFDTFYATHLNSQQKAIVDPLYGIMTVHAGAGSGKTRVITARMTSLMVHHHIQPAALLALTFTNKAAREMRERMHVFLGSTDYLPFIGTFHSYCLYFLKLHRDFLALPNFTILDDDDQEKLIRSLLVAKNVAKQVTPRQVSSAISRVKNASINGSIAYDQIPDPLLAELLMLYEKEKTASHCFDFDDLLLVTLKLLKKEPLLKQQHQDRVRHILIDEYQDTNRVQHALVKELSCNAQGQWILDSLCIVGDEDQSIYSWRGAVAGTMVTFHHDFPQVQSHTLDQNYRSAQPILDLANQLIKHNSQRRPKNLWSEKSGRDCIRLLSCHSGIQEGELLAQLCLTLQSQGLSLKDSAVFYRSHYQSRSLEEALVRYSIPYSIVGGIQFYNRQEIKDLIAYLRLVVNPFDHVAWSRAIGTPARGLGEKFQQAFLTLWESYPLLNFKEVAHTMIEQGLVTGTKREALHGFLQLFDSLDQRTPAETLEHIVTQTRYYTYLKDAYEPTEARERQENVKEFIDAVRARQEQGIGLRVLLEEIVLLQEDKRSVDEAHDYINLMTLHAAKGLEFKTVMITGLEEGVLPSNHALINPDTIEEERRLFYVGITRAQERLLMTYAHVRSTYGHKMEQRPSRFIKDITAAPSTLVSDDSSFWDTVRMRMFYHHWLRHT
jgi:DNA helicase II / ATP-dependent DNA helicase PcrA